MYKNFFLDNITDHLKILNSDKDQIIVKGIKLKDLITKCLSNNGKLLIFGNGGSAADAQHFSTELTVRLKKNRKALAAISLSTDTSAITAIGNDFNFNLIFKRQLEAISNKNDLIIPISTSGNSKNILEAVKYAYKRKNKVFGILGNKGGKVKKYCSESFIVSSKNPSRIQEIHIIFWQTVCEIVEDIYARKKN
jgi:D-sedoheptulose 7-phosphate isomerase